MKCWKLMLNLLVLTLLIPCLPAQTLPTDSEKKARDLLRDVIDQREGQRYAPAPIRTAPSIAAPPVTDMTKLPPTGLKPPARQLTYTEIEQLYLSGKISAKQFQKYLGDHRFDPTTASTTPNTQNQTLAAKEMAKAPTQTPIIMSGPQPAALTTTAPVPTPTTEAKSNGGPTAPDQSPLGEVEKKMDELLRLKAAREQAANAATLANTKNPETAGPKTKRERLDELLKLYINGKISETDYKEKRSKLVAEPEDK